MRLAWRGMKMPYIVGSCTLWDLNVVKLLVKKLYFGLPSEFHSLDKKRMSNCMGGCIYKRYFVKKL